MNHSAHRVLYQNQIYPSATHLHEAMKYLDHRPDIAERIRQCPNPADVYPLSAEYQKHQRPDWSQVYLQLVRCAVYFHRSRESENDHDMLPQMEEVLYHKLIRELSSWVQGQHRSPMLIQLTIFGERANVDGAATSLGRLLSASGIDCGQKDIDDEQYANSCLSQLVPPSLLLWISLPLSSCSTHHAQ
jgi:hypothetical protein